MTTELKLKGLSNTAGHVECLRWYRAHAAKVRREAVLAGSRPDAAWWWRMWAYDMRQCRHFCKLLRTYGVHTY